MTGRNLEVSRLADIAAPTLRQVELRFLITLIMKGVCEMHTYVSYTLNLFVGASLYLFCAIPANASLYHPGGNQAAIDYGHSFDAVGYNILYDDAGGRFRGGSNVLIAPNIVLTAAHSTTLNGSSYDNYTVGFGANIFDQLVDDEFINHYQVSDVIIHPDFSGLKSTDLLLLILDKPVADIDPVTIYEGSNPLRDTVLHGVGYGLHAQVNETPTFDGYRRAWDTNILGYGSPTTSDDYVFTEFAGTGDKDYQPLGGNARPGDSGGGLFVDTPTGLQLLAITELGWADDTAYGARVGSLVLNASERAWLNSHIVEYGIEVPEPGSLLLLLGGLGLISPKK